MLYDRPVTASNRAMSTWDSMLTAWQLRQGSVEMVHAGGRLRAKAGDWLLLPPGLARRHRFSDDAAIRSVRCLVQEAGGQLPGAGLPPRLLGDDSILTRAADDLCRAVGTDRELRSAELTPTAWAQGQAAVLTWCAIACERLGIDGRTQPVDARVTAAQRLLLRRRTPAALPWSDLREATGLSRPQLDRIFHQHCGGTVRAWSEARLLADACAALQDLTEPVKAVAERLGFGDASHFCRWFRQHTGASPALWRKRSGT